MQDPTYFADITQKICQPLFSCFPVQFYGYLEITLNGHIRTVNSDAECYAKLVSDEDYNNLTYFRMAKQFGHLMPGQYLSDLLNNPQFPLLKNSMLEKYNYAHVCWLVEWAKNQKKEDLIRVHVYAMRPSNQQVNQFYLDNFNLLHKFNNYFQEQFSAHINKLKTKRMDVECKSEFLNLMKHSKEMIIQREAKIHEFSTLCDSETLSKPNLTTRELQLINWYLLGKTAEESAMILGISRRTVEYHFEKLRKKFNCYSKSQIVMKIFNEKIMNFVLPISPQEMSQE